MSRVRFEDLIARKRLFHPFAQGPESLDHSALPVDQRTVAVERQNLEIRQSHRYARPLKKGQALVRSPLHELLVPDAYRMPRIGPELKIGSFERKPHL